MKTSKECNIIGIIRLSL